MLRGAGATSVQDALQTLQNAVLAQQKQQESAGSTLPEDASISSARSQLSVSLQDLLQRQSVLEQSLEDRSVAERALRRVVANKDAEAVRLLSEVARLRHRLSAAEAEAAAGTPTAPAAIPDAAGRQALLDAAVAAKEKPIATVLQMESGVTACQARIAALEAELTAAAAENSSRLAEQQKAFLAKLEQLRQVHAQQLAGAAAAEAAAKDSKEQQQARCKALEQLLAELKQQQEEQQVLVASLQQQLAAAQSQSSRPAAAAQAQHAQESSMHKPGVKHQQGAAAAPDSSGSNSTAASLAAGQPKGDAAAGYVTRNAAVVGRSCGKTADQAANEVAALQLMEGQLVRLSGIIKSHQEEIAHLRQALMVSCAERQQLQQHQQRQQPAAGAAAGTVAASGTEGGAGSGNSSRTPKAPPVVARGRVPAAAAVARSGSKNIRGP